MITKAVVCSINSARNRCIVRMPLFENASSASPVKAEALCNIVPGLFNNIFVGDIVFVAFEENAIEKPIILGKLFKNAQDEGNTKGGVGILDTLNVRTAASIPCTTLFVYPETLQENYEDLKTPKKIADYIKWLERTLKGLVTQIDINFRCFKNWAQWQLRPENVEVDDGDLDTPYLKQPNYLYQEESSTCNICGANCTKNKVRKYLTLDIRDYPN